MAGGLLFGCGADAAAPRTENADAAYLASQGITVPGELVLAKRVDDKDGAHVLVLSRKAGASPSAPRSGRTEHIALEAAYYARQGQAWSQVWTVRDLVDCPGLDSAAAFFGAAVTVTDLNADGKAEVTIPYKLSCGGGVDSAQIKIILREGPLKLAVRGESRVELPGQEAFGGEHTYDKALLTPARAVYKQHMDKVWAAVSVDRRK